MMDGLGQMTDASSVTLAVRTAALDPELNFAAAMRCGKRDAVSAEAGGGGRDGCPDVAPERIGR
ncbi:hypothetical protein, partial [Burkholderia pyrrocinia]|uniref:hypothetical protein n=1 Tax=Burkholderia pyrrocinia TaxID=60550 RepID=UPI001A9D3C5E